jgi:protein subunit release factor B
MLDFPAGPNQERVLSEKMSKLGIREEDIIEKFIKSSGPGGQNVNKTSTCVYLKHIPTGTEVKCQRERSQSLNRYLARKLLVKKIENTILGRVSRERELIEKIRRQKRKRPKKQKLKILEAKRQHSQKKRLRAFVYRADEY